MSRIKIVENQKKPMFPNNSNLSTEQDRYRNTGKPPLPLTSSYSPSAKRQFEDKSYNRQGVK